MFHRSRSLSTTALGAGLLSLVVTVLLAGSAAAQTAHRQPGDSARAAQAAAQSSSSTPAPAPARPGTPAPAPAPAPSGNPGSPAPAATPNVTYQVGASGPNVRTIEERLDKMQYFVGAVDDRFDEDTASGVMAFQKVIGYERTGKVGPGDWTALMSATKPAPLVSNGAANRVEIDLRRQVLFLYEGGNLTEILPVSSGSQVPYCENGNCGDAVTPTGDFKIYRQGTGWEYGPLGGLYNPQYFVGGVAVHGSLSVPPEPVSHGCVRIPMSAAEWFPGRVGVGTPVHVRG